MWVSHSVTWFDAWCEELDEALASLPERQCMPHALYRSVMQAQDADATRIAMVTRDGVPVLIAGLHRCSQYVWEPICNWHAPGPVFPSQDGYLIEGLKALRLEIPLAWWRMGTPPSQRGIRSIETSDTYRLDLSTDPQEHWRKTDYLRTIRNIRNRCKGFTYEINRPGAAEWVVRNWSRKWGLNEDHAGIEDRVRVAEWLEAHGLHLTVTLHDGSDIVGGSSNFIHGGELVAGVIYHEERYRSKGAGVRLIDLAFEVAMQRNLRAFDLGGKADYKRKWAPASGTRSSLIVAPRYLYYGRRAVGLARNLYQSARMSAPAAAQAQAMLLGTATCLV